MKRAVHLAIAGAAVLAAGPVTSQSQKVIPPKTVYWLSASTQSGFGLNAAPSAADMMRMATGGGGSGPMKMLALDLGSKLPPSPAPGAGDHVMPPVMNMGTVPLRAPKVGTPVPPSDDFERPKGKLLIFWGCGEAAKPGQPVVIDFAKVAAGQMPSNIFGGERVRIARPPSKATWPTYVYWPNADKQNGSKPVPQNASLIGAHKVTDNFAQPMDFSLQQDFMAGVAMTQKKLPSGAVALQWNVVPGSTAHFAQMVSGKDSKDGPTVVFWSSSEVQTFLSGLSDFISPSEASRLVGKKQLMPPSQTSCAIPKEAITAADQTGLLLVTSHGPEQNIVYPPRPKDPKTDWVQEWSVKARFVSRTGGILGMEDMGGMGGSAATASGKPKCKPDASAEAGKAAGGALGGSLGRAMGGALGGMMGGKKKPKTEDCEP